MTRDAVMHNADNSRFLMNASFGSLIIRGQNHRWGCRVDFDPLGLSA